MGDINLNQYSDKRSYNNLPVPEGFYLAPFLVHNWDEVKAMNYHRENLETWHFSGIAVLVAFTPVTVEQFPGTMKLFWSDVRTYIAALKKDPNILSYDKMLEDMMSEDGNGYDPAQTESLENELRYESYCSLVPGTRMTVHIRLPILHRRISFIEYP